MSGGGLFISPEDRNGQIEIARKIEKAWGVRVVLFGDATAVDGVVIGRRGEMVAAVEMKRRTHATTDYPTVFLSFRKWCMLTMAAVAFGVRPLYVVQFTDKLMAVNAAKVSGLPLNMAGRQDRGVQNDMEPIVEVPLSMMVEVREREAVACAGR